MKNIPNYVWYIIGAIVLVLIIGYFMGWFTKKSPSITSTQKVKCPPCREGGLDVYGHWNPKCCDPNA